MTISCGTVWGQLRTSHLYAVFKGPYVYFGETGHVPPVRWKGHLTSDTDFIGKLRLVDSDAVLDDSPIFFVGIHIGIADSEPGPRRKIARRAIEAELHRRFSLDPSPVTPATELLSTPPAVPVRHKFEFDKVSIAKEVYGIIAQEYQKWLRKISGANSYVDSSTIYPKNLTKSTFRHSNFRSIAIDLNFDANLK
jgi:hypothetical protein